MSVYKPNLWEAEKYALSKITITFLPRRMPVMDAAGDEIGYTAPSEGIFLAREHKIFSMLNEDEKRFFRKGVFAHELLHQIFTDFKSHEMMMKRIKPSERQIFALFANVLEDPAIEYWAKTKFGGSLLKSLKFSIAHIYEQSPGISDSPDAFSQLINALINFGDMGLIKGAFTFPEAKEIFLKIAPRFNEGILEPNGERRLQIAREIMEDARPLWEEKAKEREELEKLISEIMKSAGKDGMSGSGSGEDGDPDTLPDEKDGKEARRVKAVKKIEKAEEGDGGAKAASASSESSSSFSSSDGSSSSSSSSSSKKEEKGEGEGEEEAKSSFGDTEGENEDEADVSKDKEMTKEDRAEMKSELEKAKKEMKDEEEKSSRDTTALETEDLKCDKLVVPAARIGNMRPSWSPSFSSPYAEQVLMMSTGIANVTRQLKKMLAIAQEETEYSTRGRLNINRLNCGKNTARVFDRKRIPNDITDLVIGVAVDLSGSMRGGRIIAARKCCIALAEIFHNLNVPLYIMGYTGDVDGKKIVHRHYITWNNTKKDRESLLEVSAEAENYDGASFRYFTNIMKKKNAKHKLMIIISDGMPCGTGYFGASANKDTADAIRDARRVCEVLGVAVGNDATNVLHQFYGNDFLHVSNPNDLFAKLSVKIKKFVHKWEELE